MTRRKHPVAKETVLEAVRVAVKAAGGQRIRLRAFLGSSHIKLRDIHAHFPSWNAVLRAAGFHFDRHNQRIDDHALLADWAALVRKLQRLPSAGEYRRHGKYSISAITRRFGGWNPIIEAFRPFAVSDPRWSDILPFLPPPSSRHSPVSGTKPDLSRRSSEHSRMGEAGRRRVPDRRSSLHPSAAPISSFVIRHSSFLSPSRRKFCPLPNGRPVCGALLEIDAMRHAPINEIGVVFLFAILARRLGFHIEALQTAFPDCEAKRSVGPGAWQSVRIEFEYESRNFREHGHPADGCDIIVCWVHNWAECPKNLEVIELSEEVKRFTPNKTAQ